MFSGPFDTSGSMIARSVSEIVGGYPERHGKEQKKKKDWSWSILVVGYILYTRSLGALRAPISRLRLRHQCNDGIVRSRFIIFLFLFYLSLGH